MSSRSSSPTSRPLPHPPRVIGVYRRADLPAWEERPATLALWRLADPGNVGTLIRTADAFGAAVALSRRLRRPDLAEGAARERRLDLARARSEPGRATSTGPAGRARRARRRAARRGRPVRAGRVPARRRAGGATGRGRARRRREDPDRGRGVAERRRLGRDRALRVARRPSLLLPPNLDRRARQTQIESSPPRQGGRSNQP